MIVRVTVSFSNPNQAPLDFVKCNTPADEDHGAHCKEGVVRGVPTFIEAVCHGGYVQVKPCDAKQVGLIIQGVDYPRHMCILFHGLSTK